MFTVSLSCHHTRRWRYAVPEKGDVLWCPRCVDYKAVVIVYGPHRARCHNCSDLDAAGHNAQAMYRKACEHAELRNHIVSLWITGEARSRQVITADTRAQDLLPLDVQQA